eukprot:m.171942 g.171942  ORF g.171942 m.171942 type:complete len:172 (-) comp13447_c0_seq1:50-565(-)
MPSNVEIKAKVDDLDALKRVAEGLADRPVEHLRQSDTFFNSPNGRLKLRVVNDYAQLLFYVREDVSGPKESTFQVAPVSDPDALRTTLDLALGTVGSVEKQRWLYMIGQTRVHCDRVKGLGDYVELEVILDDGDSIEKGSKIANDLMEKLKVKPDQLCTASYVDMLNEKAD